MLVVLKSPATVRNEHVEIGAKGRVQFQQQGNGAYSNTSGEPLLKYEGHNPAGFLLYQVESSCRPSRTCWIVALIGLDLGTMLLTINCCSTPK